MTYFSNMEPRYIPDLTKPWTDTGWSPGYNLGKVLRINQKLYSFGGYQNTNIIRSTHINDPTGWTQESTTMLGSPGASFYIAIIDGYIYAFGGCDNYTGITRAPLSNPLNWVNTGATIDNRRDNTNVLVLPECGRIVIPEGFGGSGTIGYASISNPTVWASSASQPNTGWELATAALNGAVYCFGGYNASGIMRRYSAADGVTQNYVVSSLGSPMQIPPCWHIENSLWTIGGWGGPGNEIIQYSMDPSGTLISSAIVSSFPNTSTGYRGLYGDWIDPVNGYLYMQDGNTRLWRSGRKRVFSKPQIPGDSTPLIAKNENGSLTTVTSSCLLGYRSWQTNRRDLAYVSSYEQGYVIPGMVQSHWLAANSSVSSGNVDYISDESGLESLIAMNAAPVYEPTGWGGDNGPSVYVSSLSTGRNFQANGWASRISGVRKQFTIAALIQNTTAGAYATPWGFTYSNGAPYHLGPRNNGSAVEIWRGVNSQNTIYTSQTLDTSRRVLIVEYDGARHRMWINGTEVSYIVQTPITANDNATFNEFKIACWGTGTFDRADIRLAEMHIYLGTLNDVQRNGIVNSMMRRRGI
jgi:hypothetical protein